MTAKDYSRGHKIIFENGQWIYKDTKQPIYQSRPCRKCGVEFPNGEADVCLGHLPGVVNACCGHGIKGKGYIQFENGVVVSLSN